MRLVQGEADDVAGEQLTAVLQRLIGDGQTGDQVEFFYVRGVGLEEKGINYRRKRRSMINSTHDIVINRRVVVDDGETGQDPDLLFKLLEMVQFFRCREDVLDLGNGAFVGEVHLLFDGNVSVTNWRGGEEVVRISLIYNLLSLTIDQLLDHLDEHFLVARVRHTEVTESIDVHFGGWGSSREENFPGFRKTGN